MNTGTLLDLLSHTTLKGAAVLLVALLLGLALRRTAAARRYALWITAIATLAVLPLAMWALPAWHVLPQTDVGLEWPAMEPEPVIASAASVLPSEDLAVTVPTSRPVLPTSSQIVTPPSFSWNISWQDVVGTLPVVWVLMAGLLLLRLGRSAWRLRRLEASLRPGECDLLIPAAYELGLRRMPLLLIGPSDSVPMVWGVLKPRLLLPAGFETWSPEKQRGVLLHELAHLKRGDPLALWAAQWVKALHWFNPLVWLTFRQLRADQERACDDAVLRHGVRASDYAQSLLDLSRHNRLAPGLSLCALTITRCAPVEARVKAILDPTLRREGLTLRWLAGLTACALLITLPMAMLHAIEGPTLRGRILDRNGVVLAESTKEKVRVYPLKTLAAHVVGYTRTPDEEDARLHGGAGMEKMEDAALKAGKDVSLTLDARIQALTLQAMKDGGVERGAVVVLDPRTGEILASVSLPGYDPNLFVPTVSFQNWDRYLKDIGTPLLDRVSSARSAPGAVFQPFTALAALRAGKTPGTYACTPLTRGSGGGVRYSSVTRICRTSLREGAAHGPLTLEQALAKGCSSYFFQLGTEVGYPALFSMAEDLGLQQGTNIFGVKSPPLLPTMEELAKTRSSQRQLNDITTDFASGRGSPATVLQMAALYSALANGKVWEPSLTKKSAGRPRLDLNTLPDLPEGLARVCSALREAVIHPQPWARSLTSSKAQIAALADSYATGAKGPHSEVFTHHYWMAGYAPADRPALAFALYVDETSLDSTLVPDKLGPMVRRVVEEALALPADGSGEVKPFEEKSVEAQTRSDFQAAPKPPHLINKTTAKVIGQSFSASSNSLVIDKGSLDGIVANSPVITSVGLVGKTVAPEPHTTKVILLADELCRVSAKVEGTLEQGILAGERAAQAVPPQLRLRFLSRFAKIIIGSSVYSSGEGGVFPADLHLGRVKQFISGDVSGEAIVEPAVDFSTLDQVFVIEPKTAPSAQEAPTPPKPTDQAQDADILMDKQLATHWKLLQRKGFLADLPAKAVMTPSKLGNVTHGSFPFQFTASREDAQYWLANSLGDVMRQHYNKQQPWPEKPGVFDYIYEGFGGCMIHIKTLDAQTVEVRLWLKGQVPKSMLIAPDEAVPPTPKTAAPSELSEAASNNTQKRGDAAPAKFDFNGGETSRQIKALSAEPGILVKEFKMGQGKVSILGEASGMIPARKYLFKLLELRKERNVRWALPTIKALENQSVQFEASGTYGPEALNGAPSDPKASASSKPANQSQLPVSDDVIRLQPELAKQWTHLKAAGLLADLPAEAVVLATERLEKYLPSQHVFGFSIPQKEARRWLLDSVFDESQREKILNWPTLSASFNGVFTVANRCSIIVSCLNGGSVYLTIYQMASPDEIQKTRPYEKLRPFRPILIAPDESQEPQPAGRLAPEYHGKGFTQIEAKPTLNVYLQTLRPTITPLDAQLPTFRPQPRQYRLQAAAPPSAPTLDMPFPLNRLHGDLSAESEKALWRSLGNGNRMQQALVVRAPL